MSVLYWYAVYKSKNIIRIALIFGPPSSKVVPIDSYFQTICIKNMPNKFFLKQIKIMNKTD